MDDNFTIKDSGKREQHKSGMVRDVTDNKTDWERIYQGPMAERWAKHLTKGAAKYPDVSPGVPNWTLADGEEELVHARKSAARHFADWINGKRDEDHGAAVFFNINEVEYILEKMQRAANLKSCEKQPSPYSEERGQAEPAPRPQVNKHRSFLAAFALLVGFAVGMVISTSFSSAGDDWMDKYQSYQNSSALQEMRLNQEREMLRRDMDRSLRHPC